MTCEARAGPLGGKEENILPPEYLLLHLDLSLGPDCVIGALLDFDLRGVAVWQARRAIRRLGLRLRDSLLIPEGHGAEQILALLEGAAHRAVIVVGPAGVFDVEAKRSRERNGVGDMPSVGRHARPEVGAIGDRHTEVGAVGNSQ